jgi:phosphatidylglycerol lysyltransferase
MSRRILLWLLLVAFIWFVVTRLTEIENLAQTLAKGSWTWVLVAAILQVLYYVAITASYQAAFWTVEVRGRLFELLPVTFAALFVNVVAPSGNVSGMALWADDSARRGESPARTMAGALLQLILDFVAFTLVLAIGMVHLFLKHDLKVYEITGAVILFILTLALSGVLALGLWHPELLRRLLLWLKNILNRLAKRLKRADFLDDAWVERNAAEYTDASAAIARYPKRLVQTLGITMVAHIIDLASLYVLFLAFHYPIQFGALVAGYAMGILFWIVSPTPQGIGVVEGVMTLVFTSLGVPAAVAATVTLAFRGLTFWLPLLIGFIILRWVRTFGVEEKSLSESWNVRIIAILTAAMGVINVLSAVTPALAERLLILEQYSPLSVRHGGRLTAVLSGFALILLAGGLWRRKTIAWLATLGILIISALSHLIKGLDYEEALLAGILVVWLVYFRHYFHARSDRPSVQQGLRVLGVAFVFTLGYGILGFYLLDRHYNVIFGFTAALRQTVIMFTQFYDPGLTPLTGFGQYFIDSIYVVGLITFSYAAWMLLRPVFVRDPATPAERARAAEIVQQYGHSSLARMTLFDDKTYFFSPGGSYLAYTVKGRVAVALGDPIGPEEDFAATVTGFRELCSRNDWKPAFYQTLPETLAVYRAAGFEALNIGHEAVVGVQAFNLAGGANKNFRIAYNHLVKLGYKVVFHPPPIPDPILVELREISDEWLTSMHGNEKRFSLGWFDDDYIRNSFIAAVHDAQGWIIAFANLLPEYRRAEVAADLMRRRREVEPGTMDFLFVSLFQWAREQGYTAFNMGLSALSGVGEHPEDPATERILHFIYEHINQFYNFKGLHGYKNKFHPEWSPRYLIYPDAASLPAVWMAVVQANSGTGSFKQGILLMVEKFLKRIGK